ncbi:MAG: hypothetical protein INR70_04400 [Parafilimonas terrae]|nr:hypothetical protein [Parafilimonas terrae]
MAQAWDVHLLGTIQAGTLLYLTPTAQSGSQATPDVGDTVRLRGGDTSLRGQVVARQPQTVDVEIEGRGLITVQPAPSYHPGRGSGTQNEVLTLQWVVA